MKVGILTVSDRANTGAYEDETGPTVRSLIDTIAEVTQYEVIGDDFASIVDTLTRWCDDIQLDVILTNGGTGLSSSDVTPDATATVIAKEIPGMAEVMRAKGREHTPYADLSRQVVGVRGTTLIVNLPGSPKGAVESLGTVIGILGHAVETIK